MKNFLAELKFWINLYRVVKRMDAEERANLLSFSSNDVY